MDNVLLWGDGHSHSDWSEGSATLAENARLYERFEEDFHVATDHLLSHAALFRERAAC